MIYVKDVRSFGSKTVSVLIVSLSWLPLVAQNAQDVPHKVAVLEQQAQKALQEQKPEIAIPVLREIISLDPKNLNAQETSAFFCSFRAATPKRSHPCAPPCN